METKNRVTQVLEDFSVPHLGILHREVYTASQVAQASHVAPDAMAKVVVVRDAAGGHFMAVLPASTRLDLGALESAAGSARLTLVTESELMRLFPDCEAGAIPPFGGPYGMPTFVDACLRAVPQICFQPGNHHETWVLPYGDYEKLAEPVVGLFCQRHHRDAA
jgi:Ala-tRNA(Pro) deacylase